MSSANDYYDEDDQHPPATPPRTMERLFGLGDLNTQTISAAALAEQIRNTDRSTNFTTGTSIATDDFCTAVEPPASRRSTTNIFHNALETLQSPPSNILTTTLASNTFTDELSTDSGYPSDLDEHEPECHPKKNIIESSDASRSKNNQKHLFNIPEDLDSSMSATTVPTSNTVVVDSEPMHIDAAEKIYDSVKDVWAWGKGVAIISPFLGLAEGVAGKIVNVAGTDSLETLDRAVTDQVQGLDDKVFNPALAFIVKTVLEAAGKTEVFIKPIILEILKPFGLIKPHAENPEITPVAGVTVTEA